MNNVFHICNIITEDNRDCEILTEHFQKFPVNIKKEFNEEDYYDVPTLIVGWNSIKNKYPDQNIFNFKILNNLEWAYSKNENEKDFIRLVEDFFNRSIINWLPKSFTLYDSFLSKDSILDFFEFNIEKNKKTFIHFNCGALYIYNNEKNYVVNIKALACIDLNFKKTLTEILNKYQIVCFSYNNICDYLDIDILNNVLALDSLFWVKYGVEIQEQYFTIAPNIKMDKYIPFMLNKHTSIALDFEEEKFYKRMCERDKITFWLSRREIAFTQEFNKNLNFKYRKKFKLAKIKYSNKRTLTGRIVAKDEYNPQNLEHNNDDRKKIISRFNEGKILVFDYISFETKIAVYETGEKEYIEKYVQKDLHQEVSFIIYDSFETTIEEREFSKSIVHPLLYGAGDELLLKKLSCFESPELKLYQIKKFLSPIIKKSKEINGILKENGYLITPQGTIVKPNKDFAGFNNWLQTYASDIVVDKLFEIKLFLQKYKTKFLFQVHDSLVFDLNPDEFFIIEELKRLLVNYKGMVLNVSVSMGNNYKDLVRL
jgi:hypothetical protein